MRQNRHKIRLIAASYIDKEEVLSKIRYPKLLTSTRILQYEKEQELEKISRKFVRCVNMSDRKIAHLLGTWGLERVPISPGRPRTYWTSPFPDILLFSYLTE